ncbi:MAG TPA: lipid A deacylase LpxR family protein [Flavobacterium sp.]|jgi:hypothetical protein
MYGIKSYYLILIITISGLAQQSKEIGITIDNDLFTSTKNDRYYTNGIEIFYRYLNNTNSSEASKKITEFRLGQYIYTPSTPNAAKIAKQNRPFAGYLFAEAGVHIFYQSQNVFKVTAQIGVLGPPSGAAGFQETFHQAFGYNKVEGWKDQIHTTFGIQGGLLYSKAIVPAAATQRTDLHLLGKINIGTIWNGISVGPLARISLQKELQPIYNSNLYGGALNPDKAKYKIQSELYFYINPNINYQVYDATIEGSLFDNDSPVTYGLIPFRFNGEAGIKYRKNHWNLHYIFMYRGKELQNDKVNGYYYGSIGASFLLY